MTRADVLSRGRGVVMAQLSALVWSAGAKEPWCRVAHAAEEREDTADGVGERSLAELEEDFAPFLEVGHSGPLQLAKVCVAADPAADPMDEQLGGPPPKPPLPTIPCRHGHVGRWGFQRLGGYWCRYCLECKVVAGERRGRRAALAASARRLLPLAVRG